MTEQGYGAGSYDVIHRIGGQCCGEQRSEHRNRVSYDLCATSDTSEQIACNLRLIGWSVVQAEKRSGTGRNRISRWLSGVTPEPSFVQWLSLLAKWHGAWFSPLKRPLTQPTNRPPMKGREFYRTLLVIGWSERLAVARMGHNRAAFRTSLHAGGHLSEQESQWLRYLELGHLAYPAPVALSSFSN